MTSTIGRQAEPAAPPAPRSRGGFTAMKRSKWRAIVLLLAPFLALYVLAYAIPLCYAVWESFFTEKRSGLGFGAPERVFAGFGNYAAALAMPEFTSGVWRVLLLGVVQVPLMLVIALLLALAIDALANRFAAFMRLVSFLPYAVPGVIAAILWAFLYLGGTSPFVRALDPLGVHLDFLAGGTVLWSMANIITWTWTGYNMIIIYSALKAVPRELYEAASMDGAGPVRTAWSIKIPLVAPALTLTGVFSIIGTVQLYNEPMLLRPFSPAIDANYTPNMTVQNVAFSLNDYGLAAAMAVLLALGTAVLSFGFMRLSGAMTARKAAS
ncbi:sugar ABC transporter permease [uncultured Leifsonia sp.]|uniref:carbohydrate ABC transporter permease n=1 Tax=uncultured Leifsonia sp. TaxID=340359 RepID=UPI0028D76AEB|nr:sugar ABC transporter permease [uncultured Leifsonia sp.]